MGAVRRPLAVLGVVLAWLALGPWVLVPAFALLGVPAVRTRLRPTWRGTAVTAATLAALTALVVLVPEGWLPIPPGPGALVTQGYAGRPALGTPLPGVEAGSPRGPLAGPLGESPRVDTAWWGLERCDSLGVDAHDRLVGVCADGDGQSLRVVDPGSLRPVATKRLTGDCPAAWSLDGDRVLVSTGGHRLLVVATADADGDPDLTTGAVLDLGDQVGDDCPTAVRAAGDVVWWASRGGLAGTVTVSREGHAGRVRMVDVGGPVTTALAVRGATAYVATDAEVLALRRGPAGRVGIVWRSRTDGAGAGPVPLPGGLLATADTAEPRAHVEVRRAGGGDLVCRTAVFGSGASTVTGPLAPVGKGVLVTNAHGYAGPLSTVLGRTTDGGLARVDVTGEGCRVRWTSTETAPSSPATVAPGNGLAYLVTKPHSWWGADAWYLTAVDVRTGRTAFRVRTGLGPWRDNRHAAVTLGPDAAAYVPSAAGLVRVRDRD